MLAWLADKAAGELPGIIGTIISWLFKTASAAVAWLQTNLWGLMIAVGGLLYVAAVEYIRNSKSRSHHKRNHSNKKSHKD